MSDGSAKRLGFLITSLEGGGAERVVSTLASGLDGYARQLLVFEDDITYPFDGEIHVLDVPVTRSIPRLEKMWGMARGVKKLAGVRRRLALDTCVSFLTWPNLFNVLSEGSERTIISVRNNPSRSIRGKFAPVLKTMMRMLYPRADHIVAISEDVKRNLVCDFGVDPSRVSTIYNPIALDEVVDEAEKPLPKSLEKLGEHPSIVSVGRLAIQKGQWHLIRAFQRIRERVDGSRLVVLGVGPFRDYLVDLARGLGLEVWTRRDGDDTEPLDHDVIFWGFADNPFPILANSDVFAFPSLWEGLGNVVIESLASEVPVVSSDCRSGPREILAPGTSLESTTDHPEWAEYGVLLPVCDGCRYDHRAELTADERTWAEVLAEFLENPSLRQRYATGGMERVRDFSLDEVAEQWRSLLETDSVTG